MNIDATISPLPTDQAETLGLQALGWLAGQPDLAGSFLSATGASADEMKSRAADPEFLGFVLDFLLSDEAVLLGFCDETGVARDRPMRARAALPGGALPHWT